MKQWRWGIQEGGYTPIVTKGFYSEEGIKKYSSDCSSHGSQWHVVGRIQESEKEVKERRVIKRHVYIHDESGVVYLAVTKDAWRDGEWQGHTYHGEQELTVEI